MMATTNIPKATTKFCPLSVANLPQDLDSRPGFGCETPPEVRAPTNPSSYSKVPPLFKRIWYFGKGSSSSQQQSPLNSTGEPFESSREEEEEDYSRFYVPSPLSSPRRMRERLSTKLSKSPLLSRVKRKMEERPSGQSLMSPSSVNFLKSCAFGSSSSASQEEYPNHLHDSGRIANRYFESKWDAWTTMGEDMTEDDFEDDEDDSSNSYSSSSSMDDFLQLPIDDSYKRGKKSFW